MTTVRRRKRFRDEQVCTPPPARALAKWAVRATSGRMDRTDTETVTAPAGQDAPASPPADAPSCAATVWYDGECPVCRVEIAAMKRLDRGRAIDFVDITTLADTALPEGLTREDLLARFHLREGQGGPFHVGVDAFPAMWARLPFLRRAAFVFRLPLVRPLAEGFYRLFLAWQRRHRAARQKGRR